MACSGEGWRTFRRARAAARRTSAEVGMGANIGTGPAEARSGRSRCAVCGKLLLCLVFFGYSRHAKEFRLMANSAQARKRARQAGQTNKHNCELAIVAANRREAGPQGDRGRRQGCGDGKIEVVASGDRSHRGQENRPQEPRVANEVPSCACHQGHGLTGRFDPGLRAPPGALFHCCSRKSAGAVPHRHEAGYARPNAPVRHMGMAIALSPSLPCHGDEAQSLRQQGARPRAVAICAVRRPFVPTMLTSPHAAAGPLDPAPPAIERRAATAAARRGSPLAGARSGLVARAVRAIAATGFALCALIAAAAPANPGESAYTQAREIERYLYGYPKRAQEELAALLARADASPGTERRYVYALYGQAIIASGNHAEALALADRLEREARDSSDNPILATARLIRATAERMAGDAAQANAFAKSAQTLLQGTPDVYLTYWACDVDRRHGEEPGPARGIARRAAGSTVAGRARRQCIPPVRGALPAVQPVSPVETAAERAGREPCPPTSSASPREARRRW